MEVVAKFKATWADMLKFADEAQRMDSTNPTPTVSGIGPGLLTPKHRFAEDTRVPALSRYCISEEVCNLQFAASEEDKLVWRAAKDKNAARKRELLQKKKI